MSGSDIIARGLAAQAKTKSDLLDANLQPRRPMRVIGNHSPFALGFASGSTDTSGTLEMPITPYSSVSQVALLVAALNWSSGGGGYGAAELDQPNGVIVSASIVTAGRYTASRITRGGRRTVGHDGYGAAYVTDVLGVALKAGVASYLRYYTRAALPPTSPAASAVAGGYLTAATYYYVVTAIDTGIESGPTAEVSATAASTNLAIALAWSANANAERYRIYRSAASGGAKQLIAEIGPVTQYVDEGRATPNASINPPNARTRWVNGALPTGHRCNYPSAGGNGSDQTATGATADLSAVGPAFNNVSSPLAVIGDDIEATTILCDGDSRGAGAGTPESTYYQRGVHNYFDFAVRGRAKLHSINVSINGATDIEALDPRAAGSVRNRLMLYAYADIICLFNNINDVGLASDWQTVATAKLYKARLAYRLGRRVYVSTTGPYVSTTDLCLTIAGQTPDAREARRKNFNLWVRGGCQTDGSGYPVLSGGTPSPYITGYVDFPAQLEVDSNNTLAPNGGYWRVPTAADIIQTGQIITGSPTTTVIPVGAAAYPVAGEYAGMALKMTSGGVTGQVALIKTHTATSLTLYAAGAVPPGGNGTVPGLSAAPAAGDTFQIVQRYCDDGLHDGTLAARNIKAQAIIDTILTPLGL